MSLKRTRHPDDGFYTTRVKWLSNSYGLKKPVQIMQTDRLIFNPFHIEDERRSIDVDTVGDEKIPLPERDTTTEHVKDAAANSSRSLRRARNNIRDIVEGNDDLDVFITLTFDKTAVDRYSYTEIVKKLRIWLSNRSQRNGLKYVLVPEHHKDGAVHFHGFVNRSAVKLIDSGHRDKGGHTVYNVADFCFGFTTAVLVGGTDEDRQKVSCYILKYVTKGTEKVGGRYYLHGGDLRSPTYTYSNDLISDTLCSAEPYTFAPFHGSTMKIYDCRKLPDDEIYDLFQKHWRRAARSAAPAEQLAAAEIRSSAADAAELRQMQPEEWRQALISDTLCFPPSV